MPENQSLDQRRAAFAWSHVPERVSKDVVNVAAGAPALMMQNSLMQTLAYYQEKGKREHLVVLDVVADWLSSQSGVLPGDSSFQALMTRLHACDSDTYMRATEESLEILKWFRQLAKAREKVHG